MKPKAKITVPEVIEQFKEYYLKNNSWGPLSLVLLKANYNNECANFCLNEALIQKNEEAILLGKILVELSPTQRMKISKLIQ